MSNIGKQPIILPDGVEINISNDIVTIKGKKGELSLEYDKLINNEHSLQKGQGSDYIGFNKIILIDEVYDSIAVGKVIENPTTCIKLLPGDLLKLNK